MTIRERERNLNPKTIGEIWEEYQNGIGGRKPARDFTRRERNRKVNKSKYHRRNAIWKCMERLLDRGYNSNTAIRKIYQVYGFRTISQIITAMIRDERVGGHHNLR